MTKGREVHEVIFDCSASFKSPAILEHATPDIAVSKYSPTYK